MKPSALHPLIDLIDECIDRLNAARLPETVELLRMARLDLVARANGITDEELEIVALALRTASPG